MKELSKLTPSETFLIIEGKNALQKDLLKYTFMDLLLKQVLKTTKSNYRPSKHDPIQVITYVVIGKNFSGYKPLAHELVFLLPFQKSRTLTIMFRHIVKMGYENSKGKNSYQKVVENANSLNDCLSRNIFQQLFGGFSLTEKGSKLKNILNEELAYLEKHLPPLITSDKQKALQVLKTIKGNIFLLKNIDFSLLHEIDKELMEEMNPRRMDGDSGCSAWMGCVGGWGTMDNDWHSFDSSCSGHSGCSGSGCSGCSGCGGCGGD